MTKRIVSSPKNKAAYARQQKIANNLAALAAKVGRESFKAQGNALKGSKAG